MNPEPDDVPWERMAKLSPEDAAHYYPHALVMGLKFCLDITEFENPEDQKHAARIVPFFSEPIYQQEANRTAATLMAMAVLRRLAFDGRLLFVPQHAKQVLKISYPGDCRILMGAFLVALTSLQEGNDVPPETWLDAIGNTDAESASIAAEAVKLASTFAVMDMDLQKIQVH